MFVRTTLALFSLILLGGQTSAQMTFMFSDPELDLVQGTAGLQLNAVASELQVASADSIVDPGQYTTSIGFDFLGGLDGQTLDVVAENRSALPAPFFLSPTAGTATVTDGDVVTFTVSSFGAASFADLLDGDATTPLMQLEFAMGDSFDLAGDVAGAIKLTVQDTGFPTPVSLGQIGSLDMPYAGDPLYAITPSGGTSQTPVLGSSETLVLVAAGLLGDFDQDMQLTAADIDLLSQAVREQDQQPMFDLNEDGTVTGDDRTTWIGELVGTTVGDSDLDQDVDFADFLALSAGFGMPGGWANGDFDGDAQVNFADFLALSSRFGSSSAGAFAVVPEPVTSHLGLMLVIGVAAAMRSRRPAVRA